MNSGATGYRAPPIVEAIAELRFTGGREWNAGLQKEVIDRFATDYGGAMQQAGQIRVAAQVAGADVYTHGKVSMDLMFLPSADGRATIGVGPGRLSVHVLDPYPGWATFRPRIEAALRQWREIVAPEGVTFASVRYIDRVKIPESAGSFNEYFPILPSRPKSAPGGLQAFHVVTQAEDTDLDYGAVLTLASAPAEPGVLVVLYDLNVFRSPDGARLELEQVMEHVDFLHDRQKLIFEDSITDLTRGLFQ